MVGRYVRLLLAAALLPGAVVGGELPWEEAGLTEREAAAHLLDRLTFGPRPGDVDAVVEMGLEAWVERQLAGDLPDRELERRLSNAVVTDEESVAWLHYRLWVFLLSRPPRSSRILVSC